MSGADLWVLYARRLAVQHELARCYATYLCHYPGDA